MSDNPDWDDSDLVLRVVLAVLLIVAVVVAFVG